MSFHLPQDLENDIRAEVKKGHFASADAVVTEAVRSFLRQRRLFAAGKGSIGAMRGEGAALDRVVKEAMKLRQEQPWRNGLSE